MAKEGVAAWKPLGKVAAIAPHAAEAYNGVVARDRMDARIAGLRAADLRAGEVKKVRAAIAALSEADKDAVWDAIDNAKHEKPHQNNEVRLIARQMGVTAMALVREFPSAAVEI